MRDLRCMDKGKHFVAGAGGRPGGKCSKTVLQTGRGKTGSGGNKTRLGWF